MGELHQFAHGKPVLKGIESALQNCTMRNFAIVYVALALLIHVDNRQYETRMLTVCCFLDY